MESSLSLEGQNIFVTGVSRSSGIGAAIARKCAQAGANVVTHGNPAYDLNMAYPDATDHYVSDLEKELNDGGYILSALPPSDLSEPAEPERIIQSAESIFGKMNGLVLNHAYSVNAPIFSWTVDNIDKHFAVNVRASMLMIQAFAKQVDPKKGGVVTLFTSGQYLGPMTNEIAYAVSKEAIRGLCLQTAVVLAPLNIRVNCVNPGPTDTGWLTGNAYQDIAKMFPSGRWGTPEDAARLVHFLHSDYAQWITGQIIASEGGFQR